MESKRITITVDKSLHNALKHLSIVENKNLSELVINAIQNEYSHKFDELNIRNVGK